MGFLIPGSLVRVQPGVLKSTGKPVLFSLRARGSFVDSASGFTDPSIHTEPRSPGVWREGLRDAARSRYQPGRQSCRAGSGACPATGRENVLSSDSISFVPPPGPTNVPLEPAAWARRVALAPACPAPACLQNVSSRESKRQATPTATFRDPRADTEERCKAFRHGRHLVAEQAGQHEFPA